MKGPKVNCVVVVQYSHSENILNKQQKEAVQILHKTEIQTCHRNAVCLLLFTLTPLGIVIMELLCSY